MPRKLKPCDGSVQCYQRHLRRGEQPCKPSLRAWADRQKTVRARLRRGQYVARPFRTEIK
jgi:hypothetical protein